MKVREVMVLESLDSAIFAGYLVVCLDKQSAILTTAQESDCMVIQARAVTVSGASVKIGMGEENSATFQSQ